MLLSLMLAIAPVIQTQCHMGECIWMQVESNRVIHRGKTGELHQVEVRFGETKHSYGKYPRVYSPSLPTQWVKSYNYVLCSTQSPVVATKNSYTNGEYLIDFIDVFNSFGYNKTATIEYAYVCHGINYSNQGTTARLHQLGYHEGTPVVQTQSHSVSALLVPEQLKALLDSAH